MDCFEEALQIIRPLLRDGRVDFQGKYYQAHDCELRPLGPRKGGPPLLVGSFGKRMLNLTAKYADMWNTCYLGQMNTLIKPRQELWAACQEVGRDPATLGVTALLYIHYPKMIALPDGLDNPPLSGTPTQIAKDILASETAGVEHIMFHVLPYKPAAIRKLEQSLHIYHQLTSQ